MESESILALDPGESSALLLKGHALALQGDPLSAEKTYRQVLHNPNLSRRIMARLWLACLALGKGRFQSCRQEISQGLLQARETEQQRGEFSLEILAAFMETTRNRLPPALASAESALKLARETSNAESEKQALHALGLVEAKIGRLKEAMETAEKLKKLVEQTGNRRHLRYYRHLRGMIALQQGLPDQALTELEGALSLLSAQYSPTDEHAFFLEALALAYENKGDMERASQLFQEITTLTTGRLGWGNIYAESFLHLARLRQKQGFSDKAREAYRSFLRLYRNADSGLQEIREARRELEGLNRTPAF
jgi:tetratricopeptide (TPR) repeat protein